MEWDFNTVHPLTVMLHVKIDVSYDVKSCRGSSDLKRTKFWLRREEKEEEEEIERSSLNCTSEERGGGGVIYKLCYER